MLNGDITYLQSPSGLAALRSIPMWLQNLYLATYILHESGCKYWCFLPQWKSGHEHCLHNWFQFCHLTYYGTRVRLWVSMCSLEYNYIVQKRDGVDSDTDYTGFHVHSYYATSRVFIFGFSPHPTHHIIKQTDNWGRRKRSQTTCFWFVWDGIQGFRKHSRLHFTGFKAVILFWNQWDEKTKL